MADNEETIGAHRLAVFSSLPRGHQRYLFEKVTSLCAGWLRLHQIPPNQLTELELASEIWMKLVSTHSPATIEVDHPRSSTGADDPRDDSRVLWLITEIGGSQAIRHRYEDIRRQRFGRGGRLKQLEEGNEEVAEEPPYQDVGHLQGVRDAWEGVLVVARRQFSEEDDVLLLLRLLAEEPELLDDDWGPQWPIQRLVDLLNHRPPPRVWGRTQVDIAKRRLTRWIERLMHNNGFDDVDMEAFFVTVARKSRASDYKPSSPRVDLS